MNVERIIQIETSALIFHCPAIGEAIDLRWRTVIHFWPQVDSPSIVLLCYSFESCSLYSGRVLDQSRTISDCLCMKHCNASDDLDQYMDSFRFWPFIKSRYSLLEVRVGQTHGTLRDNSGQVQFSCLENSSSTQINHFSNVPWDSPEIAELTDSLIN